MKNKNCCFFGHRDFGEKEKIKERLYNLVKTKIEGGYTNFLIGNRGDFDKIALSVCRELRKVYPFIVITVVISNMSYFKKEIYEGEVVMKSLAEILYSDVETITYPIEDEHYKNQIIINNRYMVDNSDLVIGYINQKQRVSGAKRAFKYAIKTKKETINIFKDEDSFNYGKTKEQLQKEFNEFIRKI